MPAPTAYTETTAKQLIVDELGATGVALSLTTSSAQVVNAVYAVERIVGQAIADQTDMAKLEAIARWQAWRAAKAAAAGQYDLSSSGDSLKRSQFYDHIAAMLADAESVALVYDEVAAALGGGVAVVSSSGTAGSPYGWPSCSEFG